MKTHTPSPADLPENFSENCARAFFEELFRLIPYAREMFKDEIAQHRMFATTMSVILKQASDPDLLDEQLRQLGKSTS